MSTLHRFTSIALATLAISTPQAQAQQAASAPVAATSAPAVDSGQPHRIEVTAKAADVDGRLDATVGRIVLTDKDIVRYQDSNLPDLLRRVPGVDVVTAPGGTQEIRLRGLGDGYTQILLNGDPVPPGFSIDSLPPSLIERIEVQKVGSVDQSARAIAGTINIILKQRKSSTNRADMTAAVWRQSDRDSGSVSLDASGKERSTTYGVTGEVRHFRSALSKGTSYEAWDASGAPVSKQFTTSPQTTDGESISLVPRLGWQAGEGDKWKLDGFLSLTRRRVHIIEDRNLEFGDPPEYASNDLRVPSVTLSARSSIGWDHAMEAGAKLATKLGAQVNRRDSKAVLDAYDENGVLILDRHVRSLARDSTFTFSGQYRLPMLGTHAMVYGWDSAQTSRSETRIQRDVTPTGLPPNNLDDAYDAKVQRVALFAQDEFEVTETMSAYLGLRWEGLKTHSEGTTFDTVDSTSGVYSPVLNMLWKLPGKPADQVRLGFSRTYKAPEVADLMPRIYLSTNNSALEPDGQGNPKLRPELATGVDVAYEHYLPNDGLVSVSVFGRRIQDVIVMQLVHLDSGWLQSPQNMGTATTYGIEVEARTALKNLVADAPAISLRGNLVRNWSHVDAVPGPNNRLARQAPFSGNIGLEYAAANCPLKLGGNFNFQAGGPVRLLNTLSSDRRPQRTLDLFGLWSFTSGTSLRLSVTNALHQDVGVQSRYVDATGSSQQDAVSTTSATYRLTFQTQL